MGREKQQADDQQKCSFDPLQLSQALMFAAMKTQHSFHAFEPLKDSTSLFNIEDMTETFQTALEKLSTQPDKIISASQEYLKSTFQLWQNSLSVLSGQKETIDEVIEGNIPDNRFKDEMWHKNPFFGYARQSYLLWDRWIKDIATNIEDLDPKTALKIQFYTRQFTDSLSPSNFPWSNPKTVLKTIDSKGMNLIQGINNLLRDFEQGKGQIKIKMVDHDAFRLGENIAATSGKVIFQNELIQIIQYIPTTTTVFQIPVLLIPPCINKFYIYDLRPDNSFVKWLLDRGHTVFMISWVNPDQRLSEKTFEDYVFEGVGSAINTILDLTGEKKINAVGFCIGGNILGTYAAYMADEKNNPLASTTYLATLFDFKNPGDLGVFIDEKQINQLEKRISQTGYLEGQILAQTFNLLRANDLIWWFVINNYFLGQEPMAFDLLYWNSDSTNLPSKMFLYYLREMFINNNLIRPNGLKLKNKFLDLSKVKTPTFLFNTKDDHIAPWMCGYAATRVLQGPIKFVLGGSGHIAGVFNPPTVTKYGYWTSDALVDKAEEWFSAATQNQGSWWPEWAEWIEQYAGDKIKASTVGSSKYPALEDAPGSYVKIGQYQQKV